MSGLLRGDERSRRLVAHSLGFFKNRTLRQILSVAGITIVPPWSSGADGVAVWGARPVSRRGYRAAKRRKLPVVTIEDAFLRSVKPGWPEPPLGLLIDDIGLYLDASRPSRLEELLNDPTPLDKAQRARARAGIDAIRRHGLSKYNDAAPGQGGSGYVLIVDQVPGDASIALGGAEAGTFATMLSTAMAENPGATIMIRRHPRGGAGHFNALPDGVQVLPDMSPADAIDGADRVYCVTSQLGFDAMLRGKRPVVFGQPFYAGWGLSDDRAAIPRRSARPDIETFFHRVMIEFPVWIDPVRQVVCEFEDALRALITRKSAHQATQGGVTAIGMRLWKRRHIRAFFPGARFADTPGPDRNLLWASKERPELVAGQTFRVEDGFIRSAGLGAELVPAVSLCLDDLGIYYDPGRPSRLEKLIADRETLSNAERGRALALMASIREAGVSKYNLNGASPQVLAPGRCILVVGQVEDDASILKAAPGIRDNRGLLQATRRAAPEAFIAYKPHPDVEAGLRPGAIDAAEADAIWTRTNISEAISAVDTVATITSLAGFEALIHGRAVMCFGQPFYAGWGLSDDQIPAPARRTARPDLAGLVHAALIDYPLYRDPVTGLFVGPEEIIYRLKRGELRRNPMPVLSKLQGLFASFAPVWR